MMRILTVKQPWASLLVLGFKPVENRTWGTEYRGDVGILAGQSIDISAAALEFALEYLPAKSHQSTAEVVNLLPRGGVIGVMELHGIVTEMDSEWFFGPKGLLMRNPRQTKRLLPMPGNLSMFTATDQDEAIIRRYLA